MKRVRETPAAVPAEEIEFFIGSGNVFADLGLPNAEDLFARSTLVIELRRTIEARRLTQAKAAALMGVDQPKVSKLFRGDFKGFSTERLLTMLARLGRDIDIIVGPQRRSNRPGRINISTG